MSEEERCVLVVTQSLEQLASRLASRPNTSPFADEGSEGVVTVAEGAQFVALMDSVVHAAGPARMRELTLVLQPQLIPVLVSLLNAEALLRFVTEPQSAALLNQVCTFMLHGLQVRETKAPNGSDASGTSVAIVQDIARCICQAGGVDALLRLSLHAPQEEVYVAASQTLFSTLHVSPHARQRMTDDGLFRVLVRSLGDDAVPRRRHVLALCLREVVNGEPFTVASSAEAVLVLVRAFSLDDNADVQCAAAESLEMLLKTDSDQWRLFGRKRELAMGVIGILEKVDGNNNGATSDVPVAALRLLETAVRCEGCVSAQHALFLVPFLKAFGDRHLARLHAAGGKVGALSARCLRLVVQYAPPAFGLGVALMSDEHALGNMVEGLLDASAVPPTTDENKADAGQHSNAVLARVLCVEASFCIALILAQDPQCRHAFAHHLARDPASLAHVRAALVKGLNAAALEYYRDTAILDVTGVVVNDARGVQWEIGQGGQKRPTQATVRAAFDDQEERLATLVDMAEQNGDQHAGGVPARIVHTALQNLDRFFTELPRVDEQTSRLSFIMLSYATFATLRADGGGDDDDDDRGGGAADGAGGSEGRQHHHHHGGGATFPSSSQSGAGAGATAAAVAGGGESPRRPAPGVVQGILASSVRAARTDLVATADMPAPTRASLLRTWSNNPRQREALEKAAAAAAAGDTSLVVANPKASTYVDVMMRRDPSQLSQTRLRGSSPPRGASAAGGNYGDAAGAPHFAGGISLGLSQTPLKKYAFSKFDSALALATAFAQFYNKNGDTGDAAASQQGASNNGKKSGGAVVYETDGAYARRTATSGAGSARGPHYAAPTPNAKAWGIPQLKEGDLYYFSIPLSGISVAALEQIQLRAVRHLKSIKDQFAVTPHAARARRWFLFDMLNNIMPGIVTCLNELIALCDAHGEESVKFPLLLFAESAQAATINRAVGALPGAVMERGTLHSGNLIDATAQARFYFQSVTQQQQQQQQRTFASPIGAALSAGEEASSTYLRDLERKIASLAEQRFSGHERTFPSISDDEDDDLQAIAGGSRASDGAGNAVVTPGTAGSRLGGTKSSMSTNRNLDKKDLLRARPSRKRGLGRSAVDRIGDDSD